MTNPILAFGAKQRMRSSRTPLLVTLYASALALVAVLMVYRPYLQPTVAVGEMQRSLVGYVFMLALQFGLLVLVAPAMTAGSISGERERQTLDLLLVTNTGAAQIVFGKLLESFAFLALMVLSSLPMLSMVLLTGGATFAQVLVSVLFLLVVGLAGLSVGIFCSAFTKRTVSATVTAYLMMLGIGLVTLLPIFYDVHCLDMLYRKMDATGAVIAEIKNYQAISFSINPVLGLADLVNLQTAGAVGSVFGYFSATLSATQAYLPYERYLIVNIGFMVAASVALCLLATFKLGTKRHSKRKASVKG